MDLQQLAELKGACYHNPIVVYFPPGHTAVDDGAGGTTLIDNYKLAQEIVATFHNQPCDMAMPQGWLLCEIRGRDPKAVALPITGLGGRLSAMPGYYDLSARVRNIFQSFVLNGHDSPITTVNQLCALRVENLIEQRGFGETCLNEVTKWLESNGLGLAD